MNKDQKAAKIQGFLDTLSKTCFQNPDWENEIKMLVAKIQAYIDFSGFDAATKKAYQADLNNISFHGSMTDVLVRANRNSPTTIQEKQDDFDKGKENLTVFISKLKEQLDYE